ncbi:hypothetical protein ACT4UM_27890, partial [Bacillus sp. SS-TM]
MKVLEAISNVAGMYFAFFDQMVANIGPAMLCHTAANTLGSAAAGPKCKIHSSYITYRFKYFLTSLCVQNPFFTKRMVSFKDCASNPT